MTRYSYELKKQVVHDYFSGQEDTTYFVKKYGFKMNSQIRKWIDT